MRRRGCPPPSRTLKRSGRQGGLRFRPGSLGTLPARGFEPHSVPHERCYRPSRSPSPTAGRQGGKTDLRTCPATRSRHARSALRQDAYIEREDHGGSAQEASACAPMASTPEERLHHHASPPSRTVRNITEILCTYDRTAEAARTAQSQGTLHFVSEAEAVRGVSAV